MPACSWLFRGLPGEDAVSPAGRYNTWYLHKSGACNALFPTNLSGTFFSGEAGVCIPFISIAWFHFFL